MSTIPSPELLDILRTLSHRPGLDEANGTVYGLQVFGPNGKTAILDTDVVTAANAVKSVIQPELVDMSKLRGLTNERNDARQIATDIMAVIGDVFLQLTIEKLEQPDQTNTHEQLTTALTAIATGIKNLDF